MKPKNSLELHHEFYEIRKHELESLPGPKERDQAERTGPPAKGGTRTPPPHRDETQRE